MLRWHSIPSVCSVQVYWHYNQQKKRNTSPARCLCVCVLPFFSPLHSLYLVFLLSKYVHSVHTSYSSQNWILHLACIAIPKFASVTTEKTMAFINPISSLRTSAQRVLLFSFDQAFFFLFYYFHHNTASVYNYSLNAWALITFGYSAWKFRLVLLKSGCRCRYR